MAITKVINSAHSIPVERAFPFSQVEDDAGAVTVIAPGTDSRPTCQVRYEFKSDDPVLDVTSTWTNTTDKDWTPQPEDDLRTDGGNEDMRKSPNGLHDTYYFDDVYWQQAYGIRADGYRIRSESNDREGILIYEPINGDLPVVKPGESFSFRRQIIVSRDLASVLAIADRISGNTRLQPCKFTLVDALGQPISDARIQIAKEQQLRGIVRTDNNGIVTTDLPEGEYSISASIAGFQLLPAVSTVDVKSGQNQFQLSSSSYRPGRVKATITDGQGHPIPAKVQFMGHNETPSPNWGPDSAEHFVRNLAYTENGQFEIPLQEGQYNIIVSHGPEYDAAFTRINVQPDQTANLDAKLKRSVQTPGWVSSDFHSHSSPSGDNTGSQLGRVLNLAAENIEFAPCTEHNRISTYEGHIAQLGLEPFLATVSGMELTGQPLPLNHQNVFPLKYSPRTQDGGGPLTDVNPETQIERTTLWDDRSEKLVQQNHPDLGWLFYDKNGDGSPDEGFWRSFPLMDVVEVHPIDRILNLARYEMRDGKPTANQCIFNWLQLLNQGFRIYGVVNTDAHYNFHGSGWLRNWIQSSTDDPAKIDPMEMVHAGEQGRLVMSNGPYLEAVFSATDGSQSAVSGQDLVAKNGKVSVHVRVQCPNWMDVDTVFLLVNGRTVDDYEFTRAENADMFSDGVVKFDHQLNLNLKQDSHIIAVTGHRTAKLGDVMGPSGGSQYPAALTNPVFVDVDGDGFVPNKDTLGHPLPVKFGGASK